MEKIKSNKLIIIAAVIALFITLGVAVLTKKSDQKDSENRTSLEILKVIKDTLNSKDNSLLIQSCESKDFNENAFTSFSCTAYSPENNQTSLAVFKENKVEISNPITLSEDYKTLALNKPSFNEVSNLKFNLEDQIKKLMKEDKSLGSSTVFVSIGENTISKFEDRYVWEVRFVDENNRDEDNLSEVRLTKYFDANTGEELR